MQKKIKFNFGKKSYAFVLPQAAAGLTIRDPEHQVDKKKFDFELASRLPENLFSDDIISIVVADKTRLCGYKTYLPWVLDLLHQKGVSKQQIQFFIAYLGYWRFAGVGCRITTTQSQRRQQNETIFF
jgi:nickel-dependent lactate racemase